jgi:hypothetical protein
LTTLKQQKIQFLRAVTVPEISGRRVKISSPLFTHLAGPRTTALIKDLLTDRLATELASTAWTGPSPAPTSQVEDLAESTQFLLHFVDAIQPVEDPIPIKDDPSSFMANILHLPNNPIHSQSLPVSIYTSRHPLHTPVPLISQLHTVTITPPSQ